MANKVPWTHLTELLRDLLEALGCDPAQSAPIEEPDKMRYSMKVSTGKAEQAFPKDQAALEQKATLLKEMFQTLCDQYSDSIEFKIKSGGWEVVSRDSYKKSQVDDLFKLKPETELLLDLNIDKKKLLAHWELKQPQVNFKIYFSPEALARALTGPPSKLEEDNRSLFKGFTGDDKLIILVPSHDDLALDGNYLTVLGGAAAAEWHKYLPTEKPERVRLKLNSVREHLRQRPRWTGIKPGHLTPLQLFLDWPRLEQGVVNVPSGNDPIARALFAQLIVYSLLFLADNSMAHATEAAEGRPAIPDNYPWIFTFKEDKYLARVEVSNFAEIAQALTTNNQGVLWEEAQTIGRLVNWVYSEERAVDNRLIVTQIVIAGSLQDNRPSNNLKELIRRASELHERVCLRWDAFIEEKLEKYFLQIKELEQTVEATTKSYNEQIESLTKTLTDNMLAAVGVLVGTFIAAIFTSPFKPSIFLVGAGIYLAYLIIFPMRVGLTAAQERFAQCRATFLNRQADFVRRLSQAEVNDIVRNTVESGELRFKHWFKTTERLYGYVLIAFAWAMIIAAALGIWQYLAQRKQSLDVGGAFYGQPATSEVVPLLVQGSNFDKDEGIVISIGDSAFATTDEQILKLHGSTAITFSPRQQDLTSARERGNGFLFVRQGSAEPKRVPLPRDPAPIPHPVFEKWNLVAGPSGEIVEAYGINFSSISQIEFEGAILSFNVLDNGRTLRLGDQDRLAELRSGKPFRVALNNGETLQEAVWPSITKSAAAKR